MLKRSLTGIKPTGTPHIGNYFGAIRPALELAQQYEAYYFIADYHALNSIKDPKVLRHNIYEVAATWLACGLNAEKVYFYKQSDIPEVFELSTMLMSFTAKGRMNGAHAYKAQTAENQEAGRDSDKGINMGLFTYPVLMAADILLFAADIVPIGKDQLQHLEITADIAGMFNHNYKEELLTVPKPLFSDKTMLIPGTDGRKMSKSYNNTIPLFLPEKQFRKKIMKIKTNSQEIDEPKNPDSCNVFRLFSFFADEKEQQALAERYRRGGMGWGEAKEALFETANRTLKPYREKYNNYIENPRELDKVLKEGAEKAREISTKRMKLLRKKVGFCVSC